MQPIGVFLAQHMHRRDLGLLSDFFTTYGRFLPSVTLQNFLSTRLRTGSSLANCDKVSLDQPSESESNLDSIRACMAPSNSQPKMRTAFSRRQSSPPAGNLWWQQRLCVRCQVGTKQHSRPTYPHVCTPRHGERVAPDL